MEFVFLFDADSPAGRPNWAHVAYRSFFRAAARRPFGTTRILTGDLVRPGVERVLGPWRSGASAACIDALPFSRDDVLGRRNVFAILVEEAEVGWAKGIARVLDDCPTYLGHREVPARPDGIRVLETLLSPRFWGIGKGVSMIGGDEVETHDPAVEQLIREAGCTFLGYSRTRPILPSPDAVRPSQEERTPAAAPLQAAPSASWSFSASEGTLAWWSELLTGATTLDAALSTIAPGPVVDLLLHALRRGLRARVLVYHTPYQLELDVMRRLEVAAPGCLRCVRPGEDEPYSAGFALFRGRGQANLIVGSVTPAGVADTFGIGTSIRVDGQESELATPARWFDDLWARSEVIDAGWLTEANRDDADEGEGEDEEDVDDGDDEGRAAAKLREEGRRRDAALALSTTTSLRHANWETFLRELERINELWQTYDCRVFGENSWTEALEQVSPLAHEPLESLNAVQLAALFGDNLSQDDYLSCAHFGRMNGAGTARHLLTQTGRDSRHCQAKFTRALALLGAPGEPAPTPLNLARCYASLREIPGIGGAVVTRYMMLRRPDYLISANTASRRRLGKAFDLSPSAIDRWEGYRKLLDIVWAAPWMKATCPPPGKARQVWLGRASLLDAFVYEPLRHDGPSDEELEGDP